MEGSSLCYFVLFCFVIVIVCLFIIVSADQKIFAVFLLIPICIFLLFGHRQCVFLLRSGIDTQCFLTDTTAHRPVFQHLAFVLIFVSYTTFYDSSTVLSKLIISFFLFFSLFFLFTLLHRENSIKKAIKKPGQTFPQRMPQYSFFSWRNLDLLVSFLRRSCNEGEGGQYCDGF